MTRARDGSRRRISDHQSRVGLVPVVGQAGVAAAAGCLPAGLRDLAGEAPTLHCSCSLATVRVDATDTLLDVQTTTAVHRIDCPATLLWCPRGILDEPQGLYDDARLDDAGLDRTRVHVERVDDVNHYTVLLADKGASAVAVHIGRMA